jgi:phytoene dehydrogenase-like protein
MPHGIVARCQRRATLRRAGRGAVGGTGEASRSRIMKQDAGKIIIIGGGIAGLCAGVYARLSGYEVELFEKHDRLGGLATSWRRGDYTFETCLHWLVGSNPTGALHARWREVCDIDRLTFVDPAEFVRLETSRGERLSIYTNVDRLEAELLRRAPRDAAEIRRLTSTVRRFARIGLPDLTEPWRHNLRALLRSLPDLPSLRRWAALSSGEYAQRFSDPLLRCFFGGDDAARMSAVALMFCLAWMSKRNAGYPIGGSQAVIRLIAENLIRLGGRVRLACDVQSILVERDAAVGVRLAGGRTEFADWVVSAADGHATVYELLGGRYTDEVIDRTYDAMTPFPSYLQVSLGVARDLSPQPGYLTRLLDAPLVVDPATERRDVSFRFFHFDPTFAPAGKTAVTCVLPTRNFEYWVTLRRRDPERYRQEKQRVAEAVVAILEAIVPGVRAAIEVIDVSTPATVIRYTGNWKGSMEGWLLTPSTGLRPLRNTLPGLHQFLMIGHWVMPGGGLPAGLMTARAAVHSICKQDRAAFAVRPAA